MKKLSFISSFKTAILRFLAVIVTVLIIFCGLQFHSQFVRNHDSYAKYKPFFAEKNNYDILFLGTSHMFKGVYPMILYEDYGITSYNLAWHGNPIKTSYWILVNAVKYHKPKIAVLDVYYAYDNFTHHGYLHESLDAYSFSKNKIRTVQNLLVLDYTKNSKFEYLFPYSVDHNKWSSVNFSFSSLWNGDISKLEWDKEKGASYNARVERNAFFPEDLEIYKKESLSDENVDGLKDIERFVDFCRENEIIPVLVYLPPAACVLQLKESNSVQKLAERLNVPFYNFLYSDIIYFDTDIMDDNLEKKEDFFNPELCINAHLNASGARKVTEFLGKEFQAKFNLQDKRNDKTYETWNKDLSEYRNLVFGKMKKEENLDSLLMMCNFPSISAKIRVSEDFILDKVQEKLISQLGKNASLEILPEKNRQIFISIKDEKTGSIITERCFAYEEKLTARN